MEINEKRYPLSLIGSLFWLVFVLMVYYFAHKPLSDTFAENLAIALLNLATVGFLTASVAGIGRFLIRRAIDLSVLSAPEQIGFAVLAGYAVFALTVLAVGLINLSLFSMLFVSCVFLAIGFRDLRALFTDTQQWMAAWKFDTNWSRGFVIFIGLNVVLATINALAPPIAFDSLTYHLVGPKLWVTEGRFVSLPDNHFFAFPALVHTLFAAQLALSGSINGATVLHLVITLFGILIFSGYTARKFSADAGLAAGAFFFVATSFWIFISWPYVDMIVMAFSAAAIVCLDEWRSNRSIPWLVLAGVFIGLTMGSKYNAISFALISGLYVINFSWRDGIGQVIRNGAILTIAALIVLGPWLLRTWFFYDNPVYPFGPTTGQWDDLSNEFYFPDNSDFVSGNWWIITFIALTSTVLGIGGAGLFDATIGPLYLLLVPLLLLTWQTFTQEDRARIRGFALLIALGTVLWVVFSIRSLFALQTRLVIYLFPLLTILAAVSFDRLRLLPEKPLNIAFIIRTAIALVMILTALDHFAGTRQREGAEAIEGTTVMSHFVEQRALSYFFGVFDETDYLEHNLGWHIRAIQTVNDLEDGSHVLFLWETRSLYCDEPDIMCEEDTILMRWWHDRRQIGDGTAAALVEHWRSRGVDYVLVRESGREFEFDGNSLFTDEDKTEWENVPPLMEMIWEGEDNYTLYRLPTEDASGQ